MVLCEEWWLSCCEDLLKVMVHVVHHNEDIIKIVLWDDNINQFGGENVRLHLCEFPHYFDLSIDFLAMVDIVEYVLDQFYGYCLVSASFLSLDNLAKAASTKCVCNLIIFVDVSPNRRERSSLILSFHLINIKY